MSSSQDCSDRNGGSSKPFALSSSSNAPATKTAFNLQSRGRPSGPPSKGRSLPRRPHQLGHEDDSSDEEKAPVHEKIAGFDTITGAQISADGQAVSDVNQPLVIPVTSKNNWRDRAGTNAKKGRKNLLPREVQAMQEAQKNGQAPAGGAVETEGPSMAYGLSFAQRYPERGGKGIIADEDQPMMDVQPPRSEVQKPLTEDEIAMQALLRESAGEVERRTDLVIESSKPYEEEDEPFERQDDTSSFRTDVASRPEPATLDQYNAIPVEEFGAALLRGMGWKDGQSIGRGNYSSPAAADKADKARVPTRRPGFLGIGAKDSGKGAEAELGAWGKSAMRKASRKQGEENANGSTEGVYMPVMMRNKNTGEYITEEELADLKKRSSKPQTDKDDWRERRDRNLEKSGRDRDRDREYRKRDYDNDRSDKRNGASRRDRSSSAGRYSSRRSKYHDDDDRRKDDRSHRDRDRERERDSDRRRGRDDDKDYRKDHERDRKYRDDRHSSSRHSSHSSRQERDRDSRRDRRDD
ncbi:Pre-mRNA-splicing factor spp2 [Penicillium canariense]|uniref:Pre-mRNA-splicing factor n=1 Tax=Penicillium canariense TaxID=189055 RepID=A0A9W9LTQ7_9EURO|nr:Pre-mRNA-splicing factor spp2 [Penicillium canariense]KAJ5176226.1 Pre-mRNA-splicing factor spp2 [Penicillium canariense]